MVDVLPAGALQLHPTYQNPVLTSSPWGLMGYQTQYDEEVDTSSSDSVGLTDNAVDSGISTGSKSSTDSSGLGDSTSPLIKKHSDIRGLHTDTHQPVVLNPAAGVRDPVITCKITPAEAEPLIQSSLPETRDEQDGFHNCDQVKVVGDPCKHDVYIVPDTLEEGKIYTPHVPTPDGQGKISTLTSSDNSFWKKVVVIFSILDVLLLITILVVACAVKQDKPVSSPRDDNCLKCMDVYLTDDDRHDNIYNFDIKEGNLCCSKNQTLLIQKYVLKRYKQDHAKESAERYKAMPKRTAVQVYLDPEDKNSKSKGENQVLKWSREDAVINGHLTLSDSGRHIDFARKGLYYVNSKVVFADTKAAAATKESVLLLQVYRERRDQLPLLLLENRSSQCGDADKICTVPSSTQGVFLMEEGDRVFVRVTKPCGLEVKPKYNYLEAYLV